MAPRHQSVAGELARWALGYEPTGTDLQLADTALVDTVAAGVAARREPLVELLGPLGEAGQFAAQCHVLDIDDLYMPSTSHISTVVVPTAVSMDGDARAYLAGAGVMARLGHALGWKHYVSGWHATCTTGTPGAAVCAGVAMGLGEAELEQAIALSVAAAGGVQRAFGTDGKALQVAYAADAGVRAARLAASGAKTDPSVVEQWLLLLKGDPDLVMKSADPGKALPGGLAVKRYPCCYAMQRPIALAHAIAASVEPTDICAITVTTPRASMQPLIHPRPSTGLEAKFSMEYAVATGLLDEATTFRTFTDEAASRPGAQHLMSITNVETTSGGESELLDGDLTIEVKCVDGRVFKQSMQYPPGSPQVPLSVDEINAKAMACFEHANVPWKPITWTSARDALAGTG